LERGDPDGDVEDVLRDVLSAEFQRHEEQLFQLAAAKEFFGLGLGVDPGEVRSVRRGRLLLEPVKHRAPPFFVAGSTPPNIMPLYSWTKTPRPPRQRPIIS